MIAIIGAGISGLTVARELKRDFLVFEKKTVCGGLSTQYCAGNQWFDYGGHYFHFQNRAAEKRYLENVASLRPYNKQSRVCLGDRMLPYPVQFHLARFPAALRDTMLREMLDRREDLPPHLDAHVRHTFGNTLYDIFFKPYLQKFWQLPLSSLAADMDRGTIPVPDKRSLIQGAEGKIFATVGYNPVFYYPSDGLKPFIDAYAKALSSRIRLEEPVTAVDVDRRTVTTSRAVYDYEVLVNTMPLKYFLPLVHSRDPFPADSRGLRHISTLVVNAVLKRRQRRFHWAYLPEARFPFYRAGYYPARQPPVCYLERSIVTETPVPKDQVRRETTATLKQLRMIDVAKDIEFFDVKIIPVSYVVFDHAWKSLVPPTLAALRRRQIHSIGRYGSWAYTSMSEDVAQALAAARTLNGA